MPVALEHLVGQERPQGRELQQLDQEHQRLDQEHQLETERQWDLERQLVQGHQQVQEPQWEHVHTAQARWIPGIVVPNIQTSNLQ